MSDRIDTLNAFRTSKWGVILFYGYLFAILLATALIAKVIVDNHRIAGDAHRGVCALKIERERRYVQTKEILDHPNKPDNAKLISAFGKPLLLRSLSTAKADLLALKDVSC